MKVNLYPYNMINNVPLASYELFAEKIIGETEEFQLLLTRNDIDYNQDVKINIIKPTSKNILLEWLDIIPIDNLIFLISSSEIKSSKKSFL